MKVLVAFDESPDGRAVILYGMQKVSASGGELIILQRFPERLYIDYGDGPEAEYAAPKGPQDRVEGAILTCATGKPVWSRLVMVQGSIEERVVQYAHEKNVDLIVVPRRFGALDTRGCRVEVVSVEDHAAPGQPEAGRGGKTLTTPDKEARQQKGT